MYIFASSRILTVNFFVCKYPYVLCVANSLKRTLNTKGTQLKTLKLSGEIIKLYFGSDCNFI